MKRNEIEKEKKGEKSGVKSKRLLEVEPNELCEDLEGEEKRKIATNNSM